MRVLHGGDGGDRLDARRRRPARPRPAHEGQPLPLHRVPRDPRVDHRVGARPGPRDRTARSGRRPERAPARRPAGRAGPRALHVRHRPHRSAHAARAVEPARPRAHHRDRHGRGRERSTGSSRSSRTAMLPSAGIRRHGTSTRPTTPTTPACSTTSCATSASASPRSSPRRPRSPRPRAGSSASTTRSSLPSSTPSSPAHRARPVIHPDRTPEDRVEQAERNVIQSIHGGYGDVDAALAASAASVSGEWRTSRVSHAQLETHGSIGWLDDDGRLVIRTSSQVPFLTRDALCSAFRAAAGTGARLHRAGRRRLRRQAGDVHRRPRRVRGAAHRAPGGVRDEPHRRVPAHRGAASDAGERSRSARTRTARSPR